MTIETVWNNAKATYNTDTVKFPHLIEMMNNEEKGSQKREDCGIAAVLLVIQLFDDGRLGEMTKGERNILVNHIMNDL